mgnify:CR=1 FL=1
MNKVCDIISALLNAKQLRGQGLRLGQPLGFLAARQIRLIILVAAGRVRSLAATAARIALIAADLHVGRAVILVVRPCRQRHTADALFKPLGQPQRPQLGLALALLAPIFFFFFFWSKTKKRTKTE